MKNLNEVAELLDYAITVDPEAISALLTLDVRCSEELAKKTPIPCKKVAIGGGKTGYSVSPFDLIQWICDNQIKKIYALEPAGMRLKGFCRVDE